MHIGEAIIALLILPGLAGYAYRDSLYRLDLWIIAKFKELPAVKRREYRGRHHFNPREDWSRFRQDGSHFQPAGMMA